MKAKLVVVGGDAKAAEINLKLPTIIGRGREASLTLPHPLVSRQHCELFESQGHLVVRDLGSLNGTFIANERISEAQLPPGELLTIGTVTFRAVYEPEHELMPPSAFETASAEETVDSTKTVHMDASQMPPVVSDDDEGDEWDDLDTDDVSQIPTTGEVVFPRAELEATEDATHPLDREAKAEDSASKPNDDDDDDLKSFLDNLK